KNPGNVLIGNYALTSYANNGLIFGGSGSPWTFLPGSFTKGTSYTIWLAERVAFSDSPAPPTTPLNNAANGTGGPHPWDGSMPAGNNRRNDRTFNVLPVIPLPAPRSRGDTDLHGFTFNSCQVGLADGSVRSVSNKLSSTSFGW